VVVVSHNDQSFYRCADAVDSFIHILYDYGTDSIIEDISYSLIKYMNPPQYIDIAQDML